MADIYIRTRLFNGHYLTIQVDPATGIYTDPVTGADENTNTVTANLDGLTDVPVTVGADGNEVIDGDILYLVVSAIVLDDGTEKFSGFIKKANSNTLTFTDGTTVTAGDNVVVKYLPAGSDTAYADIRDSMLATSIDNLEQGLEQAATDASNSTLYNLLTGMGFLVD